MARGDFLQRVIFELVDKTSGDGKKVASVFEKIKKNALLLGAGAAAFKALKGFYDLIKRGTELASAQELADKKMATALLALGPAAEGAAAGFNEQAIALQKLGVASSETIQATQTLLLNFGIQAEAVPLATQAALDLSAALGVTLDFAARNLGRTLGGFAGELGEIIPALRGLSAEALKAGDGIALIAKQFAGQASAQAVTYAASVKRLNDALADTTKVIGESAQSPGAARSYRNLASAIEFLNEESEGSKALGFFDSLANSARNLSAHFIAIGTDILRVNGILGTQDEATEKRIETSRALELQLKREREELKKKLELEEKALKATEAFNEAVAALGVTLESEVNKEIEKNNELLLEADERLRRGKISLDDYLETEVAVAEANATLRGELTETTKTVGEFDQGIIESGAILDAYAQQAGRAGQGIQRLGVQAARATSGLRARSRSGQRAVDAAARRAAAGGFTPPSLSSDGTRINFRGGSRLAENP